MTVCVTKKAVGDSIRTRKMSSTLLELLDGGRKHTSPNPQQAGPVSSASLRVAQGVSSLHSLPACAWTSNMDQQQRQSRSLVHYTKISPSMASESESHYAYTDCFGLPEDDLPPSLGKYRGGLAWQY